MQPAPDDYTFLWRTIITLVVTLGLPWVIKISNDVVRIKTLLEELSEKVKDTDARHANRMNTQGSRHQTLVKRVTRLEQHLPRRGR